MILNVIKIFFKENKLNNKKVIKKHMLLDHK